MHKKSAFYTSARTEEYSLYGKMCYYVSAHAFYSKSHLSCKYWVAFYFAYLLIGQIITQHYILYMYMRTVTKCK
jgi:hypothetical protein